MKAATQKEKPVEASLSATMRRLLQCAEDEKRSGFKGMLYRRAAKLFQHVADVLELSGLATATSPIARDYLFILKLLTNEPEYCAAARPRDWDRLVECHLRWLKTTVPTMDQAKSTSKTNHAYDDEVHRVLGALATLLENYPGEPGPDSVDMVLDVCGALGSALDPVPMLLSRSGVGLFRAVNAFLMMCGTDVASRVDFLHQQLHGAALKSLKGRELKLKEHAVQYVRLQLTLGGVSSVQLAELRRWADEEIEKGDWRATTFGALSDILTPAKHTLLCLLAMIYAYSSGSMVYVKDDNSVNASGSAQEDEESRPAKRVKTSPTPSLEFLGALAAKKPESAGPIASILLLDYGLAFPKDELAKWIAQAVEEIPVKFAAWHAAGTADRQKYGGLMWLLRYIHALALATPRHAEQTQEFWGNAWAAVTAGLCSPSRPPLFHTTAEFECGLWAIACIAERSLCRLPSNSHTLWGLGVSQWEASPGAVAVAAAALRSGADAAAFAGLWEESVMEWATGCPGVELVSAGQAFLRLSLFSSSFSGIGSTGSTGSGGVGSSGGVFTTNANVPSLALRVSMSRAWMWWERNDAEEEKISSLICGPNYMRFKAQMTEAEAAELEAVAAAVGAAPPIAPPGVQMHEQLAEKLRQMLEAIAEKAPTSSAGTPIAAQQLWLAKMLTATASAIDVAASVAFSSSSTSSSGSSDSVPNCWKIGSPLIGVIQSILKHVGHMAVHLLCTIEGLTLDVRSALNSLIVALKRHQDATGSIDLAEPLCSMLSDLEAVFRMDAATVAAATAAAVATQAPTQFAIAPTSAAFDDELDMGTVPAPRPTGVAGKRAAGADGGGGAGTTTSTSTSTSSLAREYKHRAAVLLSSLAPIFPIGISQSVHAILAGKTASTPQLPPPHLRSVHFPLLSALCAAAATSVKLRFYEGPDLCKQAIEEMRDERGLLGWRLEKHAPTPRGRLEFILTQVQILLESLAGPHGLSTASDPIKLLSDVCWQCLWRYKSQVDGGLGSPSSLRIALNRTFSLGLLAKHAFFGSDRDRELTLDQAIESIATLVNDDVFAARLAGGQLIQSVFTKLVDPAPLYNEVKGRLDLLINCKQETDVIVPDRQETALFMLGETAAACGHFEISCLLTLVTEASLDAESLPLITATLDWVARVLGYPSRFEYASLYDPQLLHSWLMQGSSIDTLVDIRSLVAPSYESSLDQGVFLTTIAPMVVGPMVLTQNKVGLEKMSALIGVSTRDLLANQVDAVMALAFPGSVSDNEALRTMCRAVFAQNGIIKEFFGDEDHKIFTRSAIAGIGRMLAAAQDPADASLATENQSQGEAGGGGSGGAAVAVANTASTTNARSPVQEPIMPYFKPEVVVAAIAQLVEGTTLEGKREQLFTNVLHEKQVASLLLDVAKLMGRARHPRHISTAKGALRAALLLLEREVAKPATLRYALSILLRLLRSPVLRPSIVGLLSSTIGYALSAGTPASVDTLGAALPNIISTLAEAVEETIELHQVQQRLEKSYNHAPRAHLLRGGRLYSHHHALVVHLGHIDQLIQLLKSLTVRVPLVLSRYLMYVDPIPAMHGMDQVAQVVTTRRNALPPVTQLTVFASRVASMPATLRRRSMNSLRDVLFKKNNGSGGGGSDGAKIAAAAWTLAVLSADLGDAELSEFSGELLSIAGPLPARSIAFNPAALQDAVVFDRLASLGSAAWAKTNPLDSTAATIELWVTALDMLSDYVIDEDTGVVQAAQRALHFLLPTPQGKEAACRLIESKRNVITVFAEARESVATVRYLHRSPSMVLDVDELWKLGTKSYDAWVCEFASVMMKRVRSTKGRRNNKNKIN